MSTTNPSTCPICSTTLPEDSSPTRIYCSDACKELARRDREIIAEANGTSANQSTPVHTEITPAERRMIDDFIATKGASHA